MKIVKFKKRTIEGVEQKKINAAVNSETAMNFMAEYVNNRYGVSFNPEDCHIAGETRSHGIHYIIYEFNNNSTSYQFYVEF